MKICAAQFQPVKGDIKKNIDLHLRFINKAVEQGVDIIFFPELSITGYEPTLAKKLATGITDSIFNIFQKKSDSHNITIGIGAPSQGIEGIQISMFVFQPNHKRQVYSKQYLSPDEKFYFTEGHDELFICNNGFKIAPAICYESLLPAHFKKAINEQSHLYMASVAKDHSGLSKAMQYYPSKAREYKIPIIMANSLGKQDTFYSVGKSAVWNTEGQLVKQFNDTDEGLLVYDCNLEIAVTIMI